jgi:hypothetical protein
MSIDESLKILKGDTSLENCLETIRELVNEGNDEAKLFTEYGIISQERNRLEIDTRGRFTMVGVFDKICKKFPDTVFQIGVYSENGWGNGRIVYRGEIMSEIYLNGYNELEELKRNTGLEYDSNITVGMFQNPFKRFKI